MSVYDFVNSYGASRNRGSLTQIKPPKLPEELLQIDQPGDPNFEQRAFHTQAQFPAAAAQSRLFENRKRVARLVQDLQHLGAENEITDEMREAQQTGMIRKPPSMFERILGLLDAPRRTVNLAIQDIAGGDKQSASVGDYLGTLFGIRDNEDIFESTGLNPMSGSQTLSMLGVQEAETAWGKLGRFGLHVGLEILTDPLTYLTFGASAVGKRALSASASGFVKDTMKKVGTGVAESQLERRMLRRVNELEKKFAAVGKGSTEELKLVLDDLPTGSLFRDRAMKKAEEELADEVVKPIVLRDFGKLADDVVEVVPAYMRGGARLYLPLTRKLGMGIEKGILIPGTRGAGRKINRGFDKVADFLGKPGRSSAFRQKTLDIVRHARGTSDPLIHLYDGMKKGAISGTEFYYLMGAETAQQMGQSVAEAIARTNHMQGRVLAAAAEEGVFTEPSTINRTVWRFINDSNDEQLLKEFSAHGSEKFAREMIEYRNFVREQWNALAEGMKDLDPRVAKIAEKMPTWMPEVLTPAGRKMLTKLAQSGADVQRITKAAVETNDAGGFFLAAIIDSMGKGAHIPGNMTTHGNILQLGRRESENIASIPVINLVDGIDDAGNELAGRVLMVDPEELSAVPWIADMQKMLKSATQDVQLSAPQLNDLLENHIVALAEELGVDLPKEVGGRLFLEDPFEAMVEVTRHLHFSAKQLNLIDTAKKINGITPIDTFESLPHTVDNILNRIDPDKLNDALTDAVTAMKKSVYLRAKSRATAKYSKWKAQPGRRLDDPATRVRWGVDDPNLKDYGYHGFIYDVENDKFYWANARTGTHNLAVTEMFADWLEAGKLDGVGNMSKGVLGYWNKTLMQLPDMALDARTQLADSLRVAREDLLGRVPFPDKHYDDKVFEDLMDMLESSDFDVAEWTRFWDEMQTTIWDDASIDEWSTLLNEVAHDRGDMIDLADLREALGANDIRLLPPEMQAIFGDFRFQFEDWALGQGLAIRGSMYGTAMAPFGATQDDVTEFLRFGIEGQPKYESSINIESFGFERAPQEARDKIIREMEDFGRKKGNVDNLWIGHHDDVRAISPPKELTEAERFAATRKGRYELNKRLEFLAEMEAGEARDAEYRALKEIVGEDDLDQLLGSSADLTAINENAQFLRDLMEKLWGDAPRRVGTTGPIDVGTLQVTPAMSADLKRAAQIAEEFGLDKKIINAFVPVERSLGPAPGFVNPQIFGIAEPALKDQQVKKEIGLWFEQLVRNMGSVYQPLAIAQAKETATWLTRIWKTNTTITRPTFHMRNLIGGIWNNQIGGVGLSDYLTVNAAAIAVRSRMKKGASLAEALNGITNSKTRDMMWAAWESGLMDQSFSRSEFRHLVSAERRTMADSLRLFNPADPEKFGLARMGAITMESIEDFLRLAAFNRWYNPKVSRGGQIAKEMAIGLHFDYSALTEFETKIKHFVPFFVWFRRNIPLQMKTMIEQPGIINRYTHLMNSVGEEFGGDHPLDEYGTPEWWTAQAVGTNVVFNEGTPFWARWFFDPDLPVTDLTNLDPFDMKDSLSQMQDLLGPWVTLPFDLEKQSEYGPVNAPSGLNEIMQQLAKVGFFNTTADGDVQIPYLVRTLFNTALPWWGEVVETPVGPSDPKQQLRLGDAQGETNLLQRIGLRAARGAGLQLQTPQDTRANAYGTNERITQIINDLKARQVLPPPEDDPEYAARYEGLFSGR